MRVSSQLMTESIKQTLLKQSEKLLKKQETVSTGKRINRPSDDPVGAASVLYHNRLLASMDQYARNIQVGKNRMEFTETTLEAAQELVSEARNWAINQSSASVTDRDNAYFQVQRIQEQLLQLANSKMGDNYIFAGHQTDAPAFAADGTYNGDHGSYSIVTGDRRIMEIEADGSRIFQGAADLFQVMEDLLTGIQNGDSTQIADQTALLTQCRTQIENVRAETAAGFMQLELTENQMSKFHLSVENIVSRTEDADMSAAIIDLKNQETSYQAALNTGARIVQPTLMDFIR